MADTQPPTSSDPTPGKKHRGRKFLLVLVAALVLIGGGIAIGHLMLTPPSPPAGTTVATSSTASRPAPTTQSSTSAAPSTSSSTSTATSTTSASLAPASGNNGPIDDGGPNYTRSTTNPCDASVANVMLHIVWPVDSSGHTSNADLQAFRFGDGGRPTEPWTKESSLQGGMGGFTWVLGPARLIGVTVYDWDNPDPILYSKFPTSFNLRDDSRSPKEVDICGHAEG